MPRPKLTPQTPELDGPLDYANQYVFGPLHSLLRGFGLLLCSGLLSVASGSFAKAIARLMLGMFGFYSISWKKSSLKRGKVNSGELEVKPGDLVVVNHASYFDYLVMLAILPIPPQFTLLSYDGNAREASLGEALQSCWQGYPSLSESMTGNIKDIVARAKTSEKCVVVFPEGVTTNGKGLLKFLPIFSSVPSRIVLIGLKYDGNGHSPAWSIGSWLKHAWLTTVRWVHGLEVTWLDPEELNVPKTETSQYLSQQLAAISRLRVTALTAKDKIDFARFWADRRSGATKTGKSVGTVRS